MPLETLIVLLLLAFATSGTPGPDNLMLTVSGGNFGFRRSQARMAGIVLGFGAMIALVGLGLGLGLGLAGLFTASPPAILLLQVASVASMLRLTWRIAHAAPPGEGAAPAGPSPGFLQAAGFQRVDPVAWIAVLSAMAIHAHGCDLPVLLLVAAAFVPVGGPCTAVWTAPGVGLRQWLADPRRLRVFNPAMAGLPVLSLWPVPGLRGGAG